MKRFVYAAAAILLTGVIVLLAMAVAQRDARVGNASPDEAQLPYANQLAQPISVADSDTTSGFSGEDGQWPPAPIVRANDSPPSQNFPSSPPLDALPPTRTSLTSYAQSQLKSGAEYTTYSDSGNAASRASTQTRFDEPPPLGALNTLSSTPTAALPELLPTSPPSNLPNSLSAPNSNRLPVEPSNSPFAASPAQVPSTNRIPPSTLPPSTLPSNALPPNALPPTTPLTNPPPSFDTNNYSHSFSNTPVPNVEPIAIAPRTREPAPMVNAPIGSSSNAAAPIATLGPPIPYSGSPLPSTSSPSTSSPSAPSPSAPSIPSRSTAGSTAGSNVRPNGFTSAAPGGRQLDGSQNPSMEIQKRAPNEVQVGIPATFTLLVRNVGNATAFDVQVIDEVPKGAKLVRTTPPTQPSANSGLLWKLGEMAAGAEQVLTVDLIPETEGEIGSVASVNFAAQASVRTISTLPKLVVKQLLEPTILSGESLRILIDVTNLGTGTARDVRLEEDVPSNMRHSSGARTLELDVGELAPGESRKFDIELTAVEAGKVNNTIRAVSENAAVHESSTSIEVVSPKLQIGIEGPRLRYLERQATYTGSVTNTGSAMATNVDLLLYLPSGLQFNAAEDRGEYIPNQHAVMWQLAELAAGATARTKVTLLPVEEGDFVLRMQSTADMARAEPVEKPVRVEGQSELAFSIEDDNDPIETDGKTTYVVKITNTGTRVDNDVQLSIDLPEGASVEQVDAPVNYQASQRGLQFSPIAQMVSKNVQTLRFTVRHSREGTHVVRAQLKSRLRPGAVVKEESTQVYRDQ